MLRQVAGKKNPRRSGDFIFGASCGLYRYRMKFPVSVSLNDTPTSVTTVR